MQILGVSYALDYEMTMVRQTIAGWLPHQPNLITQVSFRSKPLSVRLDVTQPCKHHPKGCPWFHGEEEGEGLPLRFAHLFRSSAGFAALAPSSNGIALVLNACTTRYARLLWLYGRYPVSPLNAPTSLDRLIHEADALWALC